MFVACLSDSRHIPTLASDTKMSPFFLNVLLLLLLPFQAESAIQCLQSPAAEYGQSRRPLNTECYSDWCKRVVGTTGVVEYDCDTQGDCARNSDNDPYDPYATQVGYVKETVRQRETEIEKQR